MAENDIETKRLIVTQPKGDAFDISGNDSKDPLSHRLGGEVMHTTPPEKPLVHMVLWDEEACCEVDGRITVVGDEKQPVTVSHRFPDAHPQTHTIRSALAEPIHHALQMRTPLQVRFCNSWQVASNYTVDVELAGRRWMSIRLSGATVATPQPCPPDDDCPPVIARQPLHP
jgi:hypothetical protein